MLIISIDERNGKYVLTSDYGVVKYASDMTLKVHILELIDLWTIGKQNFEAGSIIPVTQEELGMIRDRRLHTPCWFWRMSDRREKQRFAEGEGL